MLQRIGLVILAASALGVNPANADSAFDRAVRLRDTIGDRCNYLRDEWRAAVVRGDSAADVQAVHDEMAFCVSDFQDAEARLEEMSERRRVGWSAVGAGLQALGQSMQDGADDYRRAAESIQIPPAPAPLAQQRT